MRQPTCQSAKGFSKANHRVSNAMRRVRDDFITYIEPIEIDQTEECEWESLCLCLCQFRFNRGYTYHIALRPDALTFANNIFNKIIVITDRLTGKSRTCCSIIHHHFIWRVIDWNRSINNIRCCSCSHSLHVHSDGYYWDWVLFVGANTTIEFIYSIWMLCALAQMKSTAVNWNLNVLRSLSLTSLTLAGRFGKPIGSHQINKPNNDRATHTHYIIRH